MRVRIYRPRHQRNARVLLAIALLLPAGGILQAAGVNPVSAAASVLCAFAAAFILYDSLRPVLTVLRSGLLISGALGQRATSISWNEITRVEESPGAVSISTRGAAIFQLHVDSRAARFLCRMVERQLLAGRP